MSNNMNAIVGFTIVLVSFYTLPVKFLKRSWNELSEIGRTHSVDVADEEDLPFLSWLLVLGRSLVSIGAVLLYPVLILAAAAGQNSGRAIVLAIIFGPLVSMAFIWFYGLALEFLSLLIGLVRNTRRTYEAIDRSGPAREARPESV